MNVAVQTANIKSDYLEVLGAAGQLHQRLMALIKADLPARSMLTPTQALLLYNIGEQELRPRDLTLRGYFLGSNVTHNVHHLVERGYLNHRRDNGNRREVLLSITDKGREIRALVLKRYEQQLEEVVRLSGISIEDVLTLKALLRRLGKFINAPIIY